MKNLKILLLTVVACFLLLTSYHANATKWSVNVQNFSFAPADLPNVNVGDTIRWVWVSGSHTTTSVTIPAGAAPWDHPINSSNTFFEYPVTVAGVYNYKCTPHAGMGMVGSFTATTVTPVLVSIVPNQALQGDSFTATITGSNTNFTGSPSVSMSFTNNPGEVINATSVTVISTTVLHAQFTIPLSASVGLWNVHVDALQLTNGFTVIEVVPAITFMTPNSAHQGDSFTGTVHGQNTSWSGTPSVYLSYSGNPSEIITGTNIIVTNNTQLNADFNVPSDASTGNYTIHIDALAKANGFTVLVTLTPALTGIIPDSGDQGTLVSTTITAENTSFEGGNPSVLLSLHANPAEIITGSNVVVVNNTTLTADFDIPYIATPGLWDLNVDELSLENSFTVIEVIPYLISIEPDSANQGEMVTALITAANTHFSSLEPPISLSFSNNPSEVINVSGVNVLNDNELEAILNIPPGASPGKWDVHVSSMEMVEGFTVNLISGINDPVSDLVRTYPNPASKLIFIENAVGADVSIFNSTGENILSQKIGSGKQTINISQFSRGLCIVRIRMNGQDKTDKIILN